MQAQVAMQRFYMYDNPSSTLCFSIASRNVRGSNLGSVTTEAPCDNGFNKPITMPAICTIGRIERDFSDFGSKGRKRRWLEEN
ncbi:hypothetical protein CHS0354_027460 [Potamilus streckersoni]|uniref:Uncharacterized protein n=1 Tax=Potamilus streckersoni TaxID=2493646 RepID=A0AAE0W8S2_9BIVA|nr:hypothetical protein CHS0354_027460 [Potamilus streckersoni]